MIGPLDNYCVEIFLQLTDQINYVKQTKTELI